MAPVRAAETIVEAGRALIGGQGKVRTLTESLREFVRNDDVFFIGGFGQGIHGCSRGAAPQQVARALRDFGFRMGPFEVADLAGLDVGWVARRARAVPFCQTADRYDVCSVQFLSDRGRVSRPVGPRKVRG